MYKLIDNGFCFWLSSYFLYILLNSLLKMSKKKVKVCLVLTFGPMGTKKKKIFSYKIQCIFNRQLLPKDAQQGNKHKSTGVVFSDIKHFALYHSFIFNRRIPCAN